MGYLEIIKTKIKHKKFEAKPEIINSKTTIQQDDFKPEIGIDGYLTYANQNYEQLILMAQDYYKELQTKQISLDFKYFHKMYEWLDEPYKNNKPEYYRRLFLLEYLESKTNQKKEKP